MNDIKWMQLRITEQLEMSNRFVFHPGLAKPIVLGFAPVPSQSICASTETERLYVLRTFAVRFAPEIHLCCASVTSRSTTGANRVRISPALYNNMEDINRLLSALA